ncbi:hypothetical protein BH10PSE3_BH10PSE3_14700 [soil metagenome]
MDDENDHRASHKPDSVPPLFAIHYAILKARDVGSSHTR